MMLTKRSTFTGAINTMEIPCTKGELDAYYNSGENIQNYFPNMTPEQREFIITGATQEEWDNIVGECED